MRPPRTGGGTARSARTGRHPFGARSTPRRLSPTILFNNQEPQMPVRIITADERLAAANNKTSLAIFGPWGCGKTSLLKTLPVADTVCLDLEAGMKSVQDWPGGSIAVRSFGDFRDLAVLIGGPDPAADPNAWYSAQHHQHARNVYAGTGLDR